MSPLHALFLGVIQGLTEFLPVSSSGHLVVLPKLFGLSEQPLVFDTTLHLGTTLALIAFFWSDLCVIVTSFLRDISINKLKVRKYADESLLFIKILIGSIPAGVFGIFLGDLFETRFRSVLTVAFFLTVGSAIMFFSEKKYKPLVKRPITLKKSFIIGLFQSLALFPGISRSGATISGGMLMGLKREEAARFSFLLSIPVILGAGIYEGIFSIPELHEVSMLSLFVGFLSSFGVGVLAINFLLKFLSKYKLYPFIVYRVLLAVLLVLMA